MVDMDFRLSTEQALLVETAILLLTRECPSSLVRATASGDGGPAADLFERHLRDWCALGAEPLVDLALFLIEAGAAVAPGPFLATAGLFTPLLHAVGHELAAPASTGAILGTVALPASDPDPERRRAVDLDLVDLVAVVVDEPGRSGIALVETTALESRVVETFDLARSTHAFALPDELDVFAADPAAIEVAIDRMTVAVAAEMVGVARWCVETGVEYAKQRVQFGKPIGAFQAVQHKLVDAALAYEQAAAAVAYAAMAVDADDRERRRAVHVAKASAGQAARGAAKVAMQVLAGVGFTFEHDLHLRLRRAYGDDVLLGAASWHLDRLADLLFTPVLP